MPLTAVGSRSPQGQEPTLTACWTVTPQGSEWMCLWIYDLCEGWGMYVYVHVPVLEEELEQRDRHTVLMALPSLRLENALHLE